MSTRNAKERQELVRITFSDTEITLLQKQQLYMIKSLSCKNNYLALNNSEIFRFLPNFDKNGKFLAGSAA